MGKQDSDELDQRLVRAMSHPLRVQILHILGERMASPTEMADLMDEHLSVVSYHTKTLLEYDCIELVKEEPRRGAVEHFYRAQSGAALGSWDWFKIPRSLRADMAAASLEAFTNRAIESLKAGRFQRREGSAVAWMQLMVDEEGWKEIENILEIVDGKIRVVAEGSAKRLGDANGIPVVVAFSAFETVDSGAGHDK